MTRFAAKPNPGNALNGPSNGVILPLDTDASDMIRVARVLCIIFMMTTHIWPGSDRLLIASATEPVVKAIYVVIVDSLGRASVPLLSMISGGLLVYTAMRRSPPDIISAKFKTLIFPMVVWSVPMLILLMIEAQLGLGEDAPTDLMGYVNSLFAITASPANGPLHFLRDIFIMSLYGLAVIFVAHRSVNWAVALGFGIFLLEQIPGGFLLFRNQIATFYLLGMALTAKNMLGQPPRWTWVAVLLVALIAIRESGLLETMAGNHVGMRVAEHVPRLVMSIFIWRLSLDIVRHFAYICAACKKLEPHIFTVFCAHAIVIKGFGAGAYVFGWEETAGYYPLLFVAQLIICVIAGVILSRLLQPFPWLRGKARA